LVKNEAKDAFFINCASYWLDSVPPSLWLTVVKNPLDKRTASKSWCLL